MRPPRRRQSFIESFGDQQIPIQVGAQSLQSCGGIDCISVEYNLALDFSNLAANDGTAMQRSFEVGRHTVHRLVFVSKGSQFASAVHVSKQTPVGRHALLHFPRYHHLIAYIVMNFSSCHHNRISDVVKEIVQQIMIGHVTQRFCAADGVVQIEKHEDAVFCSRSEITTRYKVQQDTLSEFSVNLSHENDYGHER